MVRQEYCTTIHSLRRAIYQKGRYLRDGGAASAVTASWSKGGFVIEPLGARDQSADRVKKRQSAAE
jgi:hypothetical protein